MLFYLFYRPSEASKNLVVTLCLNRKVSDRGDLLGLFRLRETTCLFDQPLVPCRCGPADNVQWLRGACAARCSVGRGTWRPASTTRRNCSPGCSTCCTRTSLGHRYTAPHNTHVRITSAQNTLLLLFLVITRCPATDADCVKLNLLQVVRAVAI